MEQDRKKIRSRIRPYISAIPDILRLQLVSVTVLGVLLWVLKKAMAWTLRSTGRVAVSSGDFLFLFTTWQGVLLIVLALLSLFLYVAFDLNSKILFSGKKLTKQKNIVSGSLKESFGTIRRFFCPAGIGIVLYIALLAPILNIGVSISLTEGLYIPTFITSVIHTTPLYNALYIVTLTVFALIGIANIFVLQGILLEDLSVKNALTQSRSVMRKNWKDYFKKNVMFTLWFVLLVIGLVVVVLLIPLAVLPLLPVSPHTARFLTIMICINAAIVLGTAGIFAGPFYLMHNTQLYYDYRTDEDLQYPEDIQLKRIYMVLGAAACIALVCFLSWRVNESFDLIFPIRSTCQVVAHRAGGVEGAENTVAGIRKAIELGAFGSEIDIQRTKDGYYVLNHDGTFERTAGNSGRPEDMTLEEIKALSVDGEPIATLEEILEAARDKITVFVELKGNTADRQMADDAVRIIKEAGMEEQCVLISLDYALIDYTETAYPDMKTGYLTFLSFGNTAALNCDYLGLEEESATGSAIRAIHEQGKKVLVWTPNGEESQKHFLLSMADGIITDNVSQAFGIRENLKKRTDFERILDGIFGS